MCMVMDQIALHSVQLLLQIESVEQPRFFLLFSTHFNWLLYYLLSDVVQFFRMAAVTGAEAGTSAKQSASV